MVTTTTDLEARRREEAREDERLTPRPQWERVECTCPDFCERDHELD